VDIRRLAAADAPAYRAVRLRSLQENPTAFTSSFEDDARLPPEATLQRVTSTTRKVWGAFDGGNLVGTVGLDPESRGNGRHKATIVGMYVAPEAAGHGLGRALLDVAVADARAAGFEMLVLTVTEGNSTAMKLYERAGFKSFGIEPRAIKVGGRAYAKNHMYLHLAKTT
jgi:ribosomal protein S18 acetylase RimI-like enzyme